MYLKINLVVWNLFTIAAAGIGCPGLYAQPTLKTNPQNATSPDELQRFEFEFPSMGTLVHITAYGKDRSKLEIAFRAAQQRVNELAAILTDYDPTSEARQLSSLAKNSPTKVSAPLWVVLNSADSWNKKSDGALDCSLGNLTQMWRKYRRAGRLPTGEDVVEAKRVTGWTAVVLNVADKTVSIADEKIRLDFGAIGKGYIADQAYDVLVRHEIDRCLVNISGNMRCGLPPPDKSGWTIAISPVEQGGQPIQNVKIVNQAIATSGDLWQFTLVDGVKRSHILDPHTGYGVAGPLAVTVIAPTAIDADALATIGCVQPWEKFSMLIEAQPEFSALRASRTETDLAIERSSRFAKPD